MLQSDIRAFWSNTFVNNTKGFLNKRSNEPTIVFSSLRRSFRLTNGRSTSSNWKVVIRLIPVKDPVVVFVPLVVSSFSQLLYETFFARAHSRTHTHPCAVTLTHIFCQHASTHTHTCTYTDAHTHTHMHLHWRTHTHARKHTINPILAPAANIGSENGWKKKPKIWFPLGIGNPEFLLNKMSKKKNISLLFFVAPACH